MDAISGHAPVILAPWSLQMNLNLDKTEHTSAQRKPIDQQTKPPRPPGERARNSAPTSTTLPSSNAATPSLGPASTISGSVTPTSPKPLAFASITATPNCFASPPTALHHSSRLPQQISNVALYTRYGCEPLRLTLLRARLSPLRTYTPPGA
ncbi:hypothetical protein H257_14834 [Aphanomyces astaci]|uniref:Uncharacterized protein n=1 Tax=Aphanomyces astaci TaxID=112090 RepID=W4FRK0_APHAT|nr:hypothetical protein H257_14834 [Aphanomyces astaci]ETV69464.1 hypothetical protein H257_14834 [Aphanomyces astaci]|eukprot:XP_009841037.1 hypothetical protein H257_14834 [Aphanomyces astaci]